MTENIQNTGITPEDEEKLRKIASRRTSFKIHFSIFLIANTFLWVVWFFLFKDKEEETFLTAILFLLIVWLLALILHYMIVYKWTRNYREKEFTSLKQQLLQQMNEIDSLKQEFENKKSEGNNTDNNLTD